jgi:hypothetical protein
MSDYAGLFIAGVIYVAIIYTFVKPSSKGPTIVTNVANALTDLVKGAVNG